MDSFQPDKISYGTPDFKKFQKINDNESEIKLRDNIENEKDPRIIELFKKIIGGDEPHKIIEWCAQISILDPRESTVDQIRAVEYQN